MEKISFDYSHSGVKKDDLFVYQNGINQVHSILFDQSNGDRSSLGWVSAPYESDTFVQVIQQIASQVKSKSEVLIVIGIGGSYLGSKAVIEAISPNFYNNFASHNNSLEIYFAGNNINPNYLFDLHELAKNKEVSVIVVSKSGSTIEPAVAFRIFRKMMEEKYGDAAKERIYVVTDKEEGVFKELAESKGYVLLPFPKTVGGRYSVLTPAGLLPIAAAGIDVIELLAGAKDAIEDLKDISLETNIAYQYAIIRNMLYNKGKHIELLANYEPKLHFLGEWWKQLFAESEGKGEKGIFPASVDFTTDLHSMGQYIQEGPRHMFETVINIELPFRDITIDIEEINDGCSILQNKTVSLANKQAFLGTLAAHADGGVPNLIFNMPALSPYYLGKLIFTFQVACATSAMFLNVNPFDQPGVEAYKKNMVSLIQNSQT